MNFAPITNVVLMSLPILIFLAYPFFTYWVLKKLRFKRLTALRTIVFLIFCFIFLTLANTILPRFFETHAAYEESQWVPPVGIFLILAGSFYSLKFVFKEDAQKTLRGCSIIFATPILLLMLISLALLISNR